MRVKRTMKMAIVTAMVAVVIFSVLSIGVSAEELTPSATINLYFDGTDTDLQTYDIVRGTYLLSVVANVDPYEYYAWTYHIYVDGAEVASHETYGGNYQTTISPESNVGLQITSNTDYWYANATFYLYKLPDTQTAYAEGYNNGLANGYAEGESKGYADGYIVGRDEAINEAGNAYAQGYTDGQTDGYTNGYNTGRENGLAEGQDLDNVFVQGMDGILSGLGGFFEPLLSIGVGTMTVSALLGLLVVAALIMLIVKVVRG